MAINYQPTQWNNEQEPPISADNLNHIEQGLKATADRVDELVTVEANPSDTPTDRLTALEVDGNIYEVGGGHKVYTDGGTLLPQQPNMVVKGVYSKDNATDSITEIEVVREFQNDAEVQALTGEAAKGFQHTPDNVYRARAAADITFDPTNTLLTQTRMQEAMEELDAEHLPYSGTQNMKQKIDEKADTSSVSAILPQLFFGNNKGRHYNASVTSVDALVNGVSPTTDNNGFFTVDNAGSIAGLGNRQFAFGWLNQGKTYGWIMVLSFVKPQFGTRYGASTFTMHDLY